MTGPLTHRFALSLALTAALLSGSTPAQKPAPTTSAGCGVLQGVTTCNWPAFRNIFDSAHTVAVEHAQIDRFTGKQLDELAARLGKSTASADHPGDLTFLIVPDGEHGIDFGPADQPILKLQVFSGPNSSGTLLWAENFRGDPDRPWASSVRSVIEKFEARLK